MYGSSTKGTNEKFRRGLDRDNPHFYFEFVSIRVWHAFPPDSKYAFNHTHPHDTITIETFTSLANFLVFLQHWD